MMDLALLDCFVRVVEAGGFSQAAARTTLAQPTLSRRIAQLEADLGQRLLTRTGRGVEPTEAGALLLGHAKAIIELSDRARAELRDLNRSPRGRVVVGLPPRIAQVATLGLVERFRQRFPDAVITIAEGLSVHLREWLVSGRIDLALLFDPPTTPPLSFEPLAHESLVLVAPPGTALPARVGLSALTRFPMILPSSPNAIRSLLDRTLGRRGIMLRIVAEVDTVQASMSLVAHGLGCSVLPERTVRRVGDLAIARIGPPAIRNSLVLAVPLARPATRLTRETADLLRRIDFTASSAFPTPGLPTPGLPTPGLPTPGLPTHARAGSATGSSSVARPDAATLADGARPPDGARRSRP